MKRQAYQHPELRDANDNIIQAGTYGKESPLVNGDNTGVLDYINNNLEALHDNINGSRIYVANKAALPTTGDLSAMYIAEDTGKWYLWDGTKYIETDNARKIADEAIAARDAAKASQSAAKTSETNAASSKMAAATSETNAAASKSAAASSASAAKTSEQNAGTQANTAKAWATSTTSPDGAADTASTTGKTQSAKSWALYSKDRATAAAGSASAAKTSETNANASKTAAATSATNAANSAKAAAASATAAANSAREQQADWNVTDTTSKAFIKNKPDVVTYKRGAYQQTMEWESNTIQSIVESFPDDHPDAYDYGVKVTLGKIKSEEGHTNLYFPHNGGMFLKNYWGNANNSNTSGWLTMLDNRNYSQFALPKDGTAVKATADAAGNNIQNTYAKKTDISSSVSTTSLTVTGETSVPTANAGNSSKAIANTEFVQAELQDYLPLSGGTLTGNIIAPSFQTGNAASNYFQCKKFRGGGNADSYYHAIDFGYGGHDKVDFYEYGGVWNFYKCISGKAENATRVGAITASAGWDGLVKGQDITTYAKKTDLSAAVPTGVVQAFAGRTLPNGWLLCDGSAVSRTDYAALFTAIGTTYGAGNGSTTFNLPNLVDKFVEGSATAGTVKSAGLPNINGSVLFRGADNGGLAMSETVPNDKGAFNVSSANTIYKAAYTTTAKGSGQYLYIDASRSSAIYGKSSTVQPPALTMRYIIKY